MESMYHGIMVMQLHINVIYHYTFFIFEDMNTISAI